METFKIEHDDIRVFCMILKTASYMAETVPVVRVSPF